MIPLSHNALPAIPKAVVPLLNILAHSHHIYRQPHHWVARLPSDTTPMSVADWRLLNITTPTGPLSCQLDRGLLETLLRPQLLAWPMSTLTNKILELAFTLALPDNVYNQATQITVDAASEIGDYLIGLYAMSPEGDDVLLGSLGVAEAQIMPLANLLAHHTARQVERYPPQLHLSLALHCGRAHLSPKALKQLAVGDIILLHAMTSPIARPHSATPAPPA